MSKAKRIVPKVGVGADGGDQQAERKRDQRLGQGAAAERHDRGESEQDDGEVLGRRQAEARLATGPDSSTMAIAATRPPARAENSVQPSASAGSPARAIAYPSQSSGTSMGSPGCGKEWR